MRDSTITCPYCRMENGEKSIMRPQKLVNGRISYVCSNPDCRAVSPCADTFRIARQKARKRADPILEWNDRSTTEPGRSDDYLCEYVFYNPNVPNDYPVITFYGVFSWYASEGRFNHEGCDPDRYGHCIRVLRWADVVPGTHGTEIKTELEDAV